MTDTVISPNIDLSSCDILYMRECCYLKRTDLEILTETPLPQKQNMFFGIPSVCMSICAPRWRLNGSTDSILIPNLRVYLS
jgi:hypothetical protein